MPTVFGNQQTEYVNIIKEMLMASLTYQTSYDVRFCAVKGKEKYNFHCIYIVNEIYTPNIAQKMAQRLAISSHTYILFTKVIRYKFLELRGQTKNPPTE